MSSLCLQELKPYIEHLTTEPLLAALMYLVVALIQSHPLRHPLLSNKLVHI